MTTFALILATAPQCAPLPEVVATLADQYEEHEIARAAENRGGVVMTFASSKRHVDPDRRTASRRAAHGLHGGIGNAVCGCRTGGVELTDFAAQWGGTNERTDQ